MMEATDIKKLVEIFESHPQVKAATDTIGKVNSLSLRGLHGSSEALIAAAIFRQVSNNFLFILNDLERAGYFYHDVARILDDKQVLFFPSAYRKAARYGQIDAANEILRTEVLSKLHDPKQPYLVVSYPDALAEKTVSTERLKENTLNIAVGDRIDIDFVSDILDSYQFEYVDYVYEPGQYATRGSILDVYSFSNELPYRIDFFGDEIESIRSFGVEDQLSKELYKDIRVVPEFSRDKNKGSSLFEALPQDAIVGIEDIGWVESRVESVYNDRPIIDLSKDESLVEADLMTQAEFMEQLMSFKHLRFDNKTHIMPEATLQFDTEPQPLLSKNFDLIADSLTRYMEEGYHIYILSDSRKQQQRIHDIFKDRGDNIEFTPIAKTLHEGFAEATLKVCCFTDHQIFNRFHKYSLKSDKARSGRIAFSLKEINQLQRDDYVVHIDHGIGMFGGLERITTGDKVQEVIRLNYRNGGAVFVSIHSLHKISKYKGKEGEPPRLSRLGSGVWERTKARTKSKIKDIARDLIKLYAERQKQKGFAFSPDSYLQNELEASFMYEDTPDQLKTTQDVKGDMESPQPMDRLVCGDVGFGKTEIAIRAAFKASVDGKQTAVMVPTTILANQHFKTFSRRLADFPVKIDYLSRARTAKEQREIIQRLKEGELDIIIGTHRLTSKDIEFKDLGLLIIDEEQKFGVAVKEKLRQMRANIDTLTMTATPIPRTLQFSLMGSRDLSTIDTPPPNRYPVQTEVHTFDVDLMREAIEYEMSREGQIFIVNNRIQNIYEVKNMLEREMKGVRIAVGHGQMPPKDLEKLFADFINHEYDVLIATTIIESGIDMPNVNTMIVMNAQNFGLSDLHQLRGRVGRSNRKAYCYLMAPPLYTLSDDSRRRLQAIENFSELGSGIHIAMQDLDIRGAGNLLGAEQSGFIADLGYETYQKILAEAVRELRAEEFSELHQQELEKIAEEEGSFVDDVLVESDMELLFPMMYIPNDAERVAIYRELDNMESETAILEFTKKLEDRFGKIPTEGKELIRIVRLRRLAKELSIERVTLKMKRMTLFLISDAESLYYQSPAFGKLLGFIQKNPRICQLRDINGKRSVVIKNVPSVEMAVSLLEDILNIESDE